jgi:hypothetical protein
VFAAALSFSSILNASSILTTHLDGFNPGPYAVFGRSVIDPANQQRVTSNNMDGGRFQLTRTGGDYTENLAGGSVFFAFCIEPRQFVSLGGNYTYDVQPLENGTTNINGMGLAKADKLRELFGRYLPNFAAPLTRMQGGALQIAVWEIVREDSGVLDVYNGDIYFFPGTSEDPAGVVALAQTYVQSVNGAGPKLTNLIALTNMGAQDLVTQHAPEPASTLLFGGGILLLAIGRARRNRR